jgi:hypothetical protein
MLPSLAQPLQIPGFTSLYDQASANTNEVDDRLAVAYRFSSTTSHKRDKNRMQSLLGGRIDVPGKVYRSMEKFAADHPGMFVFSRLLYSDNNSWVPCSLEYGVLKPDGKMWVECFENRGQ